MEKLNDELSNMLFNQVATAKNKSDTFTNLCRSTLVAIDNKEMTLLSAAYLITSLRQYNELDNNAAINKLFHCAFIAEVEGRNKEQAEFYKTLKQYVDSLEI